jgi:predicted phosphodiesterase
MLIGIISDTHDDMSIIRKAVDLFNEREVGYVLHAGDLISPFTLDPCSTVINIFMREQVYPHAGAGL